MDFNEARDDGLAVALAELYANDIICTLLQADNHTSTPSLQVTEEVNKHLIDMLLYVCFFM